MNQQPSASKLGDEMYSLLDTAGEDIPVFASTFVAIRSDDAAKNKDLSALLMKRPQLQEQHRLIHGRRCEVATDEKAVQRLSKEIAESNEQKKIRESQRISLLDEIEFLKSLIVDCPSPSLRRAQHKGNVPSYSPFPQALIDQIDALLSAATSRGFFSLDEEESPGFFVILDKTPGEGGVAPPRTTTSCCDQSDCASSDKKKNDEEGDGDAAYYRSIYAGSEESSSIGTSKSHYRGWCGHRSSDRKKIRPPKIPSEITIVPKKFTHASRHWKASKTLKKDAFLNLFADATEMGPGARRQKKAKKDKSTQKCESKLKKEDLHLAWLVTVMYELMDKIETGESHKDFEPSNSRNRAA